VHRSFSRGIGAFSPSADGGRGNAARIVSSECSSDFEGKVEIFPEKETFFFMRRMEGEVVETEGGPLKGSGGGISSFVGESGPEAEEVFEVCEKIESTEERMLEDTEKVELVERRVAWMRLGSAEKEAYST
jgi:hypothetical protein